ncbi:asparagine synthase-related protein [Bizionia psychrotolerans]|uniref:asparagine synthase-related protein n=1 Tax=Bizionia psychrotolerans TaxID=1492901 RepID=UPI000650C98D|nr:asparagine synthase-related protein [Bizionia psychrotolerans]
MMTINNPILPTKQVFAKKAGAPKSLHSEAICIFIATGFFMDDDTYWHDMTCLLPAHKHILDSHNILLKSTPTFNWHYSPRTIDFDTVLQEYVALFSQITKEQIGNSKVILPLSGGLDSRSQALILKGLGNPVHAYSYSFQNGFREDEIAKRIAKNCGFKFNAFTIESGYLWDVVEDLAEINGCFSEFTHPRQMAILPELKKMDGIFSLGHWGDVLFDRGVAEGIQESEVIPYLLKKIIKPKGFKLAELLWQEWQLEGDFKSFLIARIEASISKIKIDNISAKVRAFKTSQWAHRWTTTNLSVFEAAHPISLPYYDARMCEFICTIPEEYLADRRLQIAHLKQDKQLANITWQDQRPFSLNTYQYNKIPYNLPFRILSKAKRIKQELLGNPYIQRNWELQFQGADNAKNLESYLFDFSFNQWIPRSIINEMYLDYKNNDSVNGAHAISMLLTLSLWHKKHSNDF